MREVYYEAIKDTDGRYYAELQKPYNSRLHFHRAFEIAYILEGSCCYEIEEEQFTAGTDDIVFTHCYYRHRSYGDLPYRKYVIAVPAALSDDITALFADSTLPMLLQDREFNKTMLPYFEKLTFAEKNISAVLVKGYINVLFGSLAARYQNTAIQQKSRNVSMLVEILNYLDEHYQEPITLTGLAAHFGYNKSYFSRLFNQHAGISLNAYVNSLRLNHYESLTKRKSEKTVTECILEAGFSSASTFYRTKERRTAETKRE